VTAALVAQVVEAAEAQEALANALKVQNQKAKSINESNRYFQKYRFFVHLLVHRPRKYHVRHSPICINIGKKTS
ncbi:hypothetical protein V7139_25825, partial [Neobacillus drentensis]